GLRYNVRALSGPRGRDRQGASCRGFVCLLAEALPSTRVRSTVAVLVEDSPGVAWWASSPGRCPATLAGSGGFPAPSGKPRYSRHCRATPPTGSTTPRLLPSPGTGRPSAGPCPMLGLQPFGRAAAGPHPGSGPCDKEAA